MQKQRGKDSRQQFKSRLTWALTMVMLFSVLVMLILLFVLYTNHMMSELTASRSSMLTQAVQSNLADLKTIEQRAVEKSVDNAFAGKIRNCAKNGMKDIGILVEELREFKNESLRIKSIYLYLKDQDCVIGSDDGYWTAAEFYDAAALEMQHGHGITQWGHEGNYG